MAFWQKTDQLKRRAEFLASQSFVTLAISVPKDNDKTPQSAEQFFAALHGIFRGDSVIQEHICFEIAASKDSIIFYIFTPLHLKEFIESQLYAQYPTLQIKQVNDYTREIDLGGKHVATCRIKLTKEDVFPIKTFTSFEVDPLAGLAAVLANVEPGEQIWLHLNTRPVGDEWQNKGVSYVQAVRSGKSAGRTALAGLEKTGRFLLMIGQEIAKPGSGTMATTPTEAPKLSAPVEAALHAVEAKITKLGFETIFRLSVVSNTEVGARGRVISVLAALKQYNSTNLNGFMAGEIKIDDYNSWEQVINREFEEKGSILNIEELASIYHFPSVKVETSAISRVGSKKGEAPFNLPLVDIENPSDDMTVLGKTDFRSESRLFGIKQDDRMRHIYIIGKSGTGKSTLAENMAMDDVKQGRGVIVVDPHGEFADKVIASVPESRIQDTIVLDPSDREHPIGFNLLEAVGADYKSMVASGFVGIFKKIFGNSWGPRLEYILRNTVLALLDSPDTTMLGIPRMLTDPQYRNWVVGNIQDTVIRDFWVTEFAAMDVKQRTEAIAPILNKVGQFLSTSTIRNIVGQPKSTINIRKIMDEEKILVVNLSKGKIGEDNMALLGSMIVTQVQLAAMSRANVPFDQRPPCYLYVDEFQNFATESFATILSEARKYNLGLTIAHQYMAQLSEEVRDAVIGNVGTMILFRVGVPDAEALQKEYAPIFEVNDMVNLERGHVYIKLLIDGLSVPAFSAQTFPPRKMDYTYYQRVLEYSRGHYSLDRDAVEEMIEETAGYKQKRAAEEASKLAAQIIGGGGISTGYALKEQVSQKEPSNPSNIQAVKPDSTDQHKGNEATVSSTLIEEPKNHNQPPKAAIIEPAKHPVPFNQAILDSESESVGEIAPKKEKKENPLKQIGDHVFREVSQKGGEKWYMGEPAKLYVNNKIAKEKERIERRLQKLHTIALEEEISGQELSNTLVPSDNEELNSPTKQKPKGEVKQGDQTFNSDPEKSKNEDHVLQVGESIQL